MKGQKSLAKPATIRNNLIFLCLDYLPELRIEAMDFSGLVGAVREFWSFFWPAAISLTLLLGIVRAVAPIALSRILARLTELTPNAEAQLSAFKTIKRFGFDKLIPVIAAFTMLFAMDVAKTMVVLAGQALPPNVSYRYDRWFLEHSSDERQRCLWMHFEDAPSLNDFQGRVERSLSEFQAANKDSLVS